MPTVARVESLRRLLLQARALVALKSGLAAGLAWVLGAQLPGTLADYAYYASLGAISVIYPVITESFKEALRAVAAIVLGVAIAAFMQWIAWPNALTVAIVVTLGVVIGSLPWLGGQRHWVPTAALFVLVFSGDEPQGYILAYVMQLALGALTGLAVNYLLMPPMNLTSLDQVSGRMRRELIVHLRRMADLLDSDQEPDATRWQQSFDELELDRDRLHSAVDEARRASSGNPRARRWSQSRNRLRTRAEGLERVAFLVQDVGVVLHEFQGDRYQVLDAGLQHATGAAFRDLADLLERPDDDNADMLLQAEGTVQALLDQVDATTFTEPQGRYLAGLIAVSARRCLDTVAAHLDLPDPEPEQEPSPEPDTAQDDDRKPAGQA